jgi:hypothetical protein
LTSQQWLKANRINSFALDAAGEMAICVRGEVWGDVCFFGAEEATDARGQGLAGGTGWGELGESVWR